MSCPFTVDMNCLFSVSVMQIPSPGSKLSFPTCHQAIMEKAENPPSGSAPIEVLTATGGTIDTPASANISDNANNQETPTEMKEIATTLEAPTSMEVVVAAQQSDKSVPTSGANFPEASSHRPHKSTRFKSDKSGNELPESILLRRYMLI